jgi:hypothetical protein
MSESISSEKDSLLDEFQGTSEEEEEAAAIVASAIARFRGIDVAEEVLPGWGGRKLGSRCEGLVGTSRACNVRKVVDDCRGKDGL